MTKHRLGAAGRALALYLVFILAAVPAYAADAPRQEPVSTQTQEAAQETAQIQDPGALDVLVNKQNQLPKNFVPKLKALPSAYGGLSMTPEAGSAFVEMAKAAAKEGFSLRVVSGYRSYSKQTTLYQSYKRQYGEATADTFSARPGFSEHQTGLAADINTASLRTHFERTDTYRWLVEHCWDYGFILRYPEGKEEVTGYCFEPWHYRYVGVETALAVKESGLTFDEYMERTSSQPITRAQLADQLYQLTGGNARSPLPDSYKDLQQGADYLPGVAWALEQKLMAGVGTGKFDPEGAVSQSYLAVVLYRLAEPEGESPRTALSWAVEAELMGLPEDEEAPVTQRELARTLARLEQALNPEEEVPPEEGQNGQESTDQLPQEGSKTEQAAQKV